MSNLLNCTYPGCEAIVTSRVGRYSRCEEHRGLVKPGEKPRQSTTSYAARAKALVVAATKLDKTRAKAKAALAEVTAAKTEFEAARDALISHEEVSE